MSRKAIQRARRRSVAGRRDTRGRFEQWAKNPNCEANTLSAVHGISMAEVAQGEGTLPSMGQSPFAIARGQNFERGLFRNKAEALRKELENAGALPRKSTGFRDLRIRLHGGRMKDLDTSRAATEKLLQELAKVDSSRTKFPSIIASPTLRLPELVMLPETILVIDVLTAVFDGERIFITVGEIKTYPDRAGYTESSDLATARAQAGVYVHGLRTTIASLGLEQRLEVSDLGFLVLSRPGFNQPSVRAGEDLCHQAARAERGFGMLEEAAKYLPPPGKDDPHESLRNASTEYGQSCLSFCDRAPTCFSQALDRGDPRVLGEDVERFLGGLDLDRTLELLDGAEPANILEKDLQRRLLEQGLTE